MSAIDPESKDREYDYINIKLTSKGRQLLDILANQDNFEKARAILEDSAIPMTLDSLLSTFMNRF
uniref:YjcQ protein n=1 Tax=Siphoviridae sp. ctFH16 TaxID=2827817 RepID=A0A8S5TN71_9CAUD|nr:MAG TPA: YjcQ protein [Siphoviridae sp. ctFH16]